MSARTRRFQETGNVKHGDMLCADHHRLYLIGQTTSLIISDRRATGDRRSHPAGLLAWGLIAGAEVGHAVHMVLFGECPKPACRMSQP